MSYCSSAFLWGLNLWIKIRCLEYNIISTRYWYKYYQRQQQIQRWLVLLQSMALTTLYALVDCFQMISTLNYLLFPALTSIFNKTQFIREEAEICHLMLMNIHQQRAMLLAVQSLALGIRSWESCVSSVQAHHTVTFIINSTGTN